MRRCAQRNDPDIAGLRQACLTCGVNALGEENPGGDRCSARSRRPPQPAAGPNGRGGSGRKR